MCNSEEILYLGGNAKFGHKTAYRHLAARHARNSDNDNAETRCMAMSNIIHQLERSLRQKNVVIVGPMDAYIGGKSVPSAEDQASLNDAIVRFLVETNQSYRVVKSESFRNLVLGYWKNARYVFLSALIHTQQHSLRPATAPR